MSRRGWGGAEVVMITWGGVGGGGSNQKRLGIPG